MTVTPCGKSNSCSTNLSRYRAKAKPVLEAAWWWGATMSQRIANHETERVLAERKASH